MKTLYYILIIAATFGNKAHSQKIDEVLAAAGAVAGIAALAIASEQYNETLERVATNYVLRNYPGLESFQLKIINGGDNTKTFDPSNIRLQLFTLKPFDRLSGVFDEENFMVIMMITSAGWWNSNGVVYNKLSFEVLKRGVWNTMLKDYIELAAQIELEGDDYFVKREGVNAKKVESVDEKIFNITTKKDEYLRKTGDTIYFKELELLSSGEFAYYEKNGNKMKKTAIPVTNKLDGNSYLVKDFNGIFKVIFNERSFGLFYKPTGEFFQLKRSAVNEINIAWD